MPSIRASLSLALSALGVQAYIDPQGMMSTRSMLGSSATCSNPQLSCHNSSTVSNLCCFNAPGGAFLQVQLWDTNPATGPSDSWTIHGLWPDNCDGSFQANCDPNRAYTNISAILQQFGDQDTLDFMNTYWQSDSGSAESFWEHEWGKHGTCISTLDPSCYSDYTPTQEVPDFFNTVVKLFKTLPTYTWLSDAGITPSTSQTYTSAQIQKALSSKDGGYQVYLDCEDGALDSVYYFFNIKGSLQTGTFVPSQPVGGTGNCPSSGIQYLPKSGSGSGGSGSGGSGSGGSGSGSGGGSGTFSGSGFLDVYQGDSQNGCIISAGTWYTSGTCATFSASSSGSGFTLSSSKGNCAVQSGQLVCGSSVSNPTTFTANGNTLQYSGSTSFSADSAPTGSTQGKVYSGSSHSTSITIQWQSK